MATVLNFPASNADLRKARHDNDLSLVQAAIALDVVPSTLDSWERGKGSGVCPDKAFLAYKEYCQNTANMQRAGKNVLFGCFPLRVARDLLDMSIAEISDEFGYKASFWTKFEANARGVPMEVIADLESRISARMAEVCGS